MFEIAVGGLEGGRVVHFLNIEEKVVDLAPLFLVWRPTSDVSFL